jgi:hypothetical protein
MQVDAADQVALPVHVNIAEVAEDVANASAEAHVIEGEGDGGHGHGHGEGGVMGEAIVVAGAPVLMQPSPVVQAAEGLPDAAMELDPVQDNGMGAAAEEGELPAVIVQQVPRLSLRYSGSTSSGPAWLQNLHVLTRLQSLELIGCQAMSVTDCMQLAEALPRSISELTLSDAPDMNAEGLITLGKACDSLRSLTVRHSNAINFQVECVHYPE